MQAKIVDIVGIHSINNFVYFPQEILEFLTHEPFEYEYQPTDCAVLRGLPAQLSYLPFGCR